MSDSDHIIGIDLGTTNSVVAVLDGQQPRVVINSEGMPYTPSVVSFAEDGSVLVGEIARRQSVVSPESTISSAKRLMGRSLQDIETLGLQFPFRLEEKDGELVIRIGDKGYLPSQVSAHILSKLRQSAEDYLGEPVSKAIITVPAYFDDLQRQATYEAGQIAGLEVLRLINEPTAAAMAYGLGRGETERVVVYDFGGGTFDITVLEIAENTFEVLTSIGDTHLGGDDIDAILVEHLLQSFRAAAGVEFTPDATALRRLKEAAEKAKCDLSITHKTDVHLPFLAYIENQPLHLQVTITRSQLEDMIYPMVERTIDFCRTALQECELKNADIAKVLLVGGSTRIPLVADLVQDFFGIVPFKGINPDEIVAMGAAAQGGVLGGKLKEVLLLDVTPHTLGIEVESNHISRLVEKNSTIPVKVARLFTTTEDGQDMVLVHVLQGESDKASENRSLGRFTLTGLQEAKAGVPRIQVTFYINADGMVEVSAEDLATKTQKSISLLIGGDQEATGSGVRKTLQRRRPRRSTATGTSQVIAGRKPLRTSSREAVIPVRAEGDQPAFQSLHSSPAPHIQPIDLPAPTATPPPAATPSRLTATPVPSGTPAPAATPIPSGTPIPAATPMPRTLPSPGAISPLSAISALRADADADTTVTPPPAQRPIRVTEGPPVAPPLRDVFSPHLGHALLCAAKNMVDAGSVQAYRDSLQELRNFVSANPGDKEVLQSLARVLILLGDEAESKNLLRRIAEQTQPPDSGASSLFELFSQCFPEDAEIIAAHAQVLQAAGSIDAAISTYERICSEERGSDTQAVRLIGLYQTKLAETEDAATQFKLVKLLLRAKRTDEAMEILQRLTESAAYRERALKILGLCFWQKGMHYLAWQKFQLLPVAADIQDILYRLATDMMETDQVLNAKYVLERLFEIDATYRDVEKRLKQVEGDIKQQSQEMDRTRDLPGLLLLNDSRFVIIEEINRGSMGTVYRAKDKVLDEIVALKILNDYLTSDPSAVERFKREARAAKKLSHPNVVRIHDMYEYGTKKILSMEYIIGQDLKRIIRERKTVDTADLVHIARSVCAAVGYAHGLNIVHRDIKPANIMITDQNVVKVTDFGIAKILFGGRDATRTGSQIVGTPLYMSPEQVTGERVDGRADIYSLGIMMYEMVTGRAPFCEGNIEYHHLHSAPPPLPETVNERLRAVILRCLEKNPDDRFQNTDEVSAALAAVLE